MTESEVKVSLAADAETNADKYPLSPTEVERIVKAWFYTGTTFDAALVTRARYCRVVAEGWRKRAGKAAADPLKYLDMGNPVESVSPFRQMKQMEQNWLDEAERLERAAAATTTTAGVQGTSTVRAVPSY